MGESEIYGLLANRAHILEIDYYDPKATDIQFTIEKAIRDNFETYAIDFIIETYTKLGRAPSILYDDNGNFAVSEDGVQNGIDGGISTIISTVDISFWKPTIREALRHWVFDGYSS